MVGRMSLQAFDAGLRTSSLTFGDPQSCPVCPRVSDAVSELVEL